jgi:hypothetical protein
VTPYWPPANGWPFPPVEARCDFGRLSEGFCPVADHGLLERVPDMPDAGWCPACGLGWSTTDDQPQIHLRRRRVGPA